MSQPLVKQRELERITAAANALLEKITVIPPDDDYYAYVNAGAAAIDNAYVNAYADANAYLNQVSPNTTYSYLAAAAAAQRLKNRKGSGLQQVFLFSDLPPVEKHAEEQLLWVTACEFEQCFEEWEWEAMWRPGDIVNFDDAIEVLRLQRCDDDEEQWVITTVTVDDETETFCEDGWFDEVDMPMIEALALRAELAADPDWVLQILQNIGVDVIAIMAGQRTRDPIQVIEAIIKDPNNGLGGAALDYLIWQAPEYCGPAGAQLAEILEELTQECWLRVCPVENFLLHSGSLHPGTLGYPSPYQKSKTLYPMKGAYTINKIDYHSDRTGKVVAGWRSCWLEPYNDPSNQ